MINYDNTNSGMAATQIQAAVDELNANKQSKIDNNLSTTSKETTGAINELKSGLINLSTVTDISSQFVVDDIKVAYFKAYRCGNNVDMVIRTGSGEHASGETLVTVPAGLRPAEGGYAIMFNWSNDSIITTATAYNSPSDGTIKTQGAYNAIAFMRFSYIIGN